MRHREIRICALARSALKRGAPTLPLFAVFGLPVIALLTLGNPINQAGGLDAFIYTALIHDYGDVIARYGRAYYTTRIAFIYPARLFAGLFGSEQGYMLLRYVMLAAGNAAIYAVARRYFDRPLAIFAALTFCFSPWIVRSLMWDHYDGFAAIYLLLSMYFLLVPERRLLYASALAGVFYALAVNCNVFNLAIGGALLPAWLFAVRHRPVPEIAVRVVAALIGFVATYAVLALVVYFEFPELGFAFEYVSFGMVRWLLEGGASNWFIPFSKMAENRNFFPFAIGGVLLSMAAWLATGRFDLSGAVAPKFFILSFGYLSIAVSVFLFMHFVVHAGVISYFYYVVFLLPVTTVAMLALAGEACAGLRDTSRVALLAVGGLVFLSIWFGFEAVRPVVQTQAWPAFAILAVAPAALLLLRRIVPMLAATGAVAMFVTVPLTFYGNGHYFGLHSPQSAALERDVYRAAVHFQRIVAETVKPADGRIGFWYGNEPEHVYLNSIQSTHLWGFSRLQSMDRSVPGMPVVNDDLLIRLQSVDYAVLLGPDDAAVAAGEAALAAANVPYTPILRDRFEGARWGFSSAILELGKRETPDTPALYTFAMNSLSARNGAALTKAGDAVHLRGSPRPYNFSFVQRLVPAGLALSGPGVLYVRLKVTKGKFGVGILKAGGSSDFIGEVAVRARTKPSNIEIRIEDLAQAGDLVFREASPDGGSEAELYLVKVSRPE